MANIDRGSRITFAQAKAHFDGIAKAAQIAAAAIGDDFTSFITSGYTANTPVKDIDIAIDGTSTGLSTPLSIDAVSRIGPVLHRIRKSMTEQHLSATTAAMVAWGFGDYIKAIMSAIGDFDDTYDGFWAAWAALRTAASDSTYIPGEVVDIMNAIGIKSDPSYCHPPTHKYLADIDFTGAAAATLTTKDEIDPTLYHNHTTEWYIVTRDGTPDAIDIVFAGGVDENDTPTDTGATAFDLDVLIGETTAGTTGDVTSTDSGELCSTVDATMTITGGKDGDRLALRVKQPRAYSLPS